MKNYYVEEDEPKFEDLDKEKQKILLGWIKENFSPIKNTNYKVSSSYGLKHIMQKENPEDYYFTNEQFKKAMLLCGFVPGDAYKRNWHFNISSKSPAFKK